ncbi:hypothetical protein [Nocardia gipuzkoensis]|uniref:hypothetical protein n=1 Tax=Nocardia gipuzkoensis TaxID=2749991 RepID=UPI00237E0F3D|nr:hypothetical protein [Nocardia gipuzkoensis]MDE1672659.1 hypothetical protein [Nocardia gipuzkoensis]
MTQPSDTNRSLQPPAAPPTPSQPELLRQTMRDYYEQPEPANTTAAIERDLLTFDRLATLITPGAPSRAWERETMTFPAADRDAFIEWLNNVGLSEAASLAYALENNEDGPTPAVVDTSLSILHSLRDERFERAAEKLDNYRYLRAAEAEIRRRISAGQLSADTAPDGARLAEAYFDLQHVFTPVPSGFSRTEQRSIIDLTRMDVDLREKSDAELLAVCASDATAAQPFPRFTTGDQLAAQVDELAVWRRLITDQPARPYEARFASVWPTFQTLATRWETEAQAREWLLTHSEAVAANVVVSAAVFGIDPATSRHRYCWRAEDMPASEVSDHLRLLAQAREIPLATGDYTQDHQRLRLITAEFAEATQQLSDPRSRHLWFETRIHRDNLRATISEFAAAAHLSIEARWRVTGIEQAQKPFGYERKQVSFLDEHMTRLEMDLSVLRADGISVDVTGAPADDDRPYTSIGWMSDSDHPDQPWFRTRWNLRFDTWSDRMERFGTLPELLARHPAHAEAAAALTEFQHQLTRAQSIVDASRAQLDTIRDATPVTRLAQPADQPDGATTSVPDTTPDAGLTHQGRADTPTPAVEPAQNKPPRPAPQAKPRTTQQRRAQPPPQPGPRKRTLGL